MHRGRFFRLDLQRCHEQGLLFSIESNDVKISEPRRPLSELAAEAAEAEDRVQLDRVRRDARLPVVEVEEATPVTRARAHSRTWLRATRICRRRYGVAWLVQLGDGASEIM